MGCLSFILLFFCVIHAKKRLITDDVQITLEWDKTFVKADITPDGKMLRSPVCF